MTIYHTETEEDYNSLMVELEKQGFRWYSGHNPTHLKYWSDWKEDTCIEISGKKITFNSIATFFVCLEIIGFRFYHYCFGTTKKYTKIKLYG